jgi:hypothetical protein
MFYEDENACSCGNDCADPKEENCSCGCDCGSEDQETSGEGVITMTDTETGEEYTFIIADDFSIEDDQYCVLVTMDEKDPELVITKVVTLEDGSEGLMSLDDEEYDRVYAEYERLCEEDDDEDADEDAPVEE